MEIDWAEVEFSVQVLVAGSIPVHLLMLFQVSIVGFICTHLQTNLIEEFRILMFISSLILFVYCVCGELSTERAILRWGFKSHMI